VVLVGCGGKSQDTRVDGGDGLEELTSGPVIQDFVIGPGDQISISVFGQRELDRKVRVEGTGEIYYPLVGYITIEGMTSKELRTFLTEKISKYYVDPEVGISIIGIRSNKIFVLGSVTAPGVYPIDYPVTVFEVVLRAGGFNDRSKKSSILLIRGAEGEGEVFKLDLEKVYKKGDKEDDMYVQGGDIIYVPENFLTNAEDFAGHISRLVRPFLDIERGVILWPTFVDVLEGQDSR
jgi:polysaccharide export outer membrane protein